MSNYIPPNEDILLELLDAGIVANGEVFLDYLPTWSEIGANTNIVTAIKLTTGISNPRWARDNITISIRVSGRNRQDLVAARTKTNEIYNFLVGKDTFQRGDYVYTQFNSVVFPNLIGYQDNSAPLFVCSISLVREAQVKEGNRDPLC